MIELGIQGLEFIVGNTDRQVLRRSLAPKRIQLGPRLTRGMGAGGKPVIGEGAAEESTPDIRDALSGSDMVFITAGLGGGTGTGAAPVAARIAHECGAIVVAVVTMPFSFELGKRQENARKGLESLLPYCDTLITVPNDRLLQVAPANLPLETAFRLADDVLRQAIQGISELITQPGFINVDFAHVRRVMEHGGGAVMALGQAEGEGSARRAVEAALHHPMLDEIALNQAMAIIANFSASSTLAFADVMDALRFLHDQAAPDAEIIPGITLDPRLEERTEVILIITGLAALPVEHGCGISNAFSGSAPSERGRFADTTQPSEPAILEPKLAPAPSPQIDPEDIPAFIRFQRSGPRARQS
jgi:cell division protein FtsZ